MLRDTLQKLQDGKISLDDAADEIAGLRVEAVGNFARLDLGRRIRCGIPEVVLAEGKETGQLAEISVKLAERSGRCIVTRVVPGQAQAIQDCASAAGIGVQYHNIARIVVLSTGKYEEIQVGEGIVGIITAGTSDIPVAEEARVIAEELGCSVRTAYDVGAAGIHRLFPAIREISDAHVYVVAAGREGTLPSVVAGLVDRPVIGVPVSTGYGYMGGGRAALASMLQSCSVIAVVNIDAGFTAGAFAASVAKMACGHD
jgi:NCAIR mutase (PurE)-related protein